VLALLVGLFRLPLMVYWLQMPSRQSLLQSATDHSSIMTASKLQLALIID